MDNAINTQYDVFLEFDSDTGIDFDRVINNSKPTFEQQVGVVDGGCSTSSTKSCRQASTALNPGEYRVMPSAGTAVESPCSVVRFSAQGDAPFTVTGDGSSIIDITPPEVIVCPASIVGQDANGCFLSDVTDIPVFTDCSAITLSQSAPLSAGNTVTVTATDRDGNQSECAMTVTGTGCSTETPTSEPSSYPSDEPSSKPSSDPSDEPSSEPSAAPSVLPSVQPSATPSVSGMPSVQPTLSTMPSCSPSMNPSPTKSNKNSGKKSAGCSSKKAKHKGKGNKM